MKKISLLLIIFTIIKFSMSQNNEKYYFDISGKKTDANNAYYYRVLDKAPNYYKSYYISNNKIYFEGTLKEVDFNNDNNNRFEGVCIWYHKNEQKKVEKIYNTTGQLDGKTIFYYENGKISKEIEYKSNSIVDNKYTEYSEKGEKIMIYEHNFANDSYSDWDLYSSDKSISKVENGFLEIKSLTKEGTSRYINFPVSSDEFIIETAIDFSNSKSNKIGLLWGFKDWNNYNYLSISNNYYWVGQVYEGVNVPRIEGMFSSDLYKKELNTIKLFSSDGKLIVTFNGKIQNKTKDLRIEGGRGIGYILSGANEIKVKNLIVKEFSGSSSYGSSSDISVKSYGSGFILTKDGYIATNYHVVENNNKILVDVMLNNEVKTYEAKVVQKDEQNDLAIIKISDQNFKIDTINYSFSENVINVGASVFTIGYPLALQGMGSEAKFVDGKISAKTGYDNAINSFQTSIPVQPGNSGGPVFNEYGQLVGIINSKVKSADNVSYAIKLNYLKNIFELIPNINYPNSKKLDNLNLEEKIKILSKYVVLIKIK